jgi:hypothetical protein
MAYFVTGGTGFIGRFLIENLLKRGEPVYVLVRKGSQKKLAALRETWGVGEERVIAVVGDLTKPNLGVPDAELKKLKDKIKHLFHLAAIYDLSASAEAQQIANMMNRHTIELRASRPRGLLPSRQPHCRGGLYEGTFARTCSRRPRSLTHPYFNTARLRRHRQRVQAAVANLIGRASRGPFAERLHRQIDGRIFFADPEDARDASACADDRHRGGRIPVDFVANALDYLAHKKGSTACFHPPPGLHRIAKCSTSSPGGARPQMTMRINGANVRLHPSSTPYGIAS